MPNQSHRQHLIDNIHLLSPEPDTSRSITKSTQAILISGNRIKAIIQNSEEISSLRSGAAVVVDGIGKVAMPGLINGHCHTYGTVLRGTENSQPLEVWALYTMAYGKCLDPGLVRSAVGLSAVEMIRNGVTSVIDHIPHLGLLEHTLAAHRESGMRVGAAPFMQDIPDHKFLKFELPDELRRHLETPLPMSANDTTTFFESFFEKLRDMPDRIIAMIGPNAPQRCSQELWQVWRQLQQKYDAPVHTHLLETELQARQSQKIWQGGLVAEMARQNLLNDKLSVAHGIWLQECERELLSRHGATLIHNPVSNLMLGSGRMPYQKYRELGMLIGIGSDSDSANTAGRHDIFEAARLAAMLPRLGEPDYDKWPTAGEVMTSSIQAGAKALGLKVELGQLQPGQLADLILLDMDELNLAGPVLNTELIAQHAGRENVSDVMINGNWVMRDRRLAAINEERLLADFRDQKATFLARAESELEVAGEIAPFIKQALARNKSA